MNNYQNNRMNPQAYRNMPQCRQPEPMPCPQTCRKPDVPVCRKDIRSKAVLLKEINEISFAVTDMNLYLDSHPCDEKALEYMCEHVKRRKELLKEYARSYGPLTIDTTDDVMSDSWEWALTPWPWEGGAC